MSDYHLDRNTFKGQTFEEASNPALRDRFDMSSAGMEIGA